MFDVCEDYAIVGVGWNALVCPNDVAIVNANLLPLSLTHTQ
jgi:hypothetical protein